MKSKASNIFTGFIVIFVVLSACQTSKKVVKQPQSTSDFAVMFDTSKVFSSNLTGFALYDPARDSMIYAQNENRYFTPASNIKLLTFYAGLKLLPDSLRALEYTVRGDSLVFWGTGDPSFLHPDIGNGNVYHFLKSSDKRLFYSDSNFEDELRGPGWSWSGYQFGYQTEKTPFPMYGNTVTFTVQSIDLQKLATTEDGSLAVSPPFFRSYLQKQPVEDEKDPILFRELDDNQFTYKSRSDTTTYEVNKPYHYTPQLATDMLSDTLEKPVTYTTTLHTPDSTQTLYSIPTDTAYKYMLQQSDNFIAEQLLLVAAAELGKPLKAELVIDKMKSEYLDFLSRDPQWVDGSGLSRYNMVTPKSIIQLLGKIDDEFESDQELFDLLPAGGERGTIESWYASEETDKPYVFAKTGTLSNNHCLSGYIVTKSGKKLLFSFMNNHYVSSSDAVKKEMERVLWYIYNRY